MDDFISSINDLPEEIRWDLTLALIYKTGQFLEQACEWAVQNSRKVEEFDFAVQIRSNNENLATLLNTFIETEGLAG